MYAWKKTISKPQKPKRHVRNEDSGESGCVVSGSLALVLRASRALALSPLSARRARFGWRVAPSRSLSALQRLLLTAFNIATLASVGWDLTLDVPKRVRAGDTTLKTVVWICDWFLLLLIASISTYMGLSRMKSLLKVLKQLQQIHFDLKINPPSAKLETIRSFVIVSFLTWSIALQIVDIYNLTQMALKEEKQFVGPIMAMSVTYNYTNIVEVMVALQWYYSALGTHTAAAAINQQLQELRDVNLNSGSTSALDDSFTGAQSVLNLVNNVIKPENSTTAETLVQTTIRRLALSYCRIGDVMMQMNAGNGIILILMIMANFLRLVLSPYYLLLNVLVNDDAVVLSYVLLQGNWIAFHIFKLLLIVEPCHWTQEQREYTEYLLSQLTTHLAPKSETVSKELDQFAKQVALNKAKFMPLGMSTLSRPLIVTILSSVTTYLIIIIQFQKISTHL